MVKPYGSEHKTPPLFRLAVLHLSLKSGSAINLVAISIQSPAVFTPIAEPGKCFPFFFPLLFFLSFSSRNTEMRKVVVAPCLDPACGLQPPSALGRCGYWQMGRREKSQYYTSSCSNFSPLPLKWCGRRCRHRRKLEAELVMTKVNRPLDPILPAITLKWLSLLRREEKPSVVGASLPD